MQEGILERRKIELHFQGNNTRFRKEIETRVQGNNTCQRLRETFGKDCLHCEIARDVGVDEGYEHFHD